MSTFPEDAEISVSAEMDDSEISWQVDDREITVSADKAGTALLTVSIEVDEETYSDTCSFTITPTVEVAPEDSATVLWGHTVGDLQEDIAVDNQSPAITGTLKYVSSGALATDWGPGYFVAVKFDPDDEVTSTYVGLDPSASGMSLAQLDEDLNAVFKVSDKDHQALKVQWHWTDDGRARQRTKRFDLSGLTLGPIPGE